MNQVVLKAEIRTENGKGPARRLRKTGKIPGVMYKGGSPTLHLSIKLNHLKEAMEGGRNTLITLKLDEAEDSGEHVVMVRELQRDPVHDHILHVDLIGIDLEKPLEVDIPLELVSTPVGVTTGGILQQSLRRLLVRCLPSAIPRRISVDVKALELGQSLHVSDLQLPEGVECVEDPETPVASVVAPAIEVEEEKPEEEAAEEAEGEEAEGEKAEGEKAEKAEKKEGEPAKKKKDSS